MTVPWSSGLVDSHANPNYAKRRTTRRTLISSRMGHQIVRHAIADCGYPCHGSDNSPFQGRNRNPCEASCNAP